ncbi:MAG TPA: DegT/DnrJ/EryC1/StrS family aminotransferase [Chryseosolibacter sp.]
MEIPKRSFTRREFLKKNSLAAGAGVALGMGIPSVPLFAGAINNSDTPAILGGTPVHRGDWQRWPVWNPETDEKRVLEVLRSGVWSRAEVVTEFEAAWAKTMGAKRCLTVVNGTNALICAIANFDIGAGDEVIVPPYTFIATIQAVLQNGAIPVFVDTDPETFQIDARKIEEKITGRTRAILPVHLAGLPADMERIMAIARKHNLLVIEDACQAWLAEVNHKKVGTIGNAGCFSFQNSKHIPMGEGGAVVSDDDEFMDKCFSYHSFGSPYGAVGGDSGSGIVRLGTKLRLTEYQAAMGLAQLKRLEDQSKTRSENAAYLTSLMKEIPGIAPHTLYPEVTRAAFHLYPFRYQKAEFMGLSRDSFLKALRAEGVPCSTGYTPLNKMPFLGNAFRTKNFQRMYSKEMLNIEKYYADNECPENDRLCNEEAVWFTQNMLLGPKSDMNDIASAIGKIRKNAAKIKQQIG